MHLCDDCRAERDWEHGTQVDYLIKANLAKKEDDPSKARCCECTRIGGSPTFIRNPLFQICKKCAERLKECQHCRKSMLPQEELDRQERHEVLLDLLTLAMKAFGLTDAKALFRLQAEELGFQDRHAFDGVSPLELDRREGRPIWRKVLAANLYRHPRYCDRCRGPHGPFLSKAERCSHWTIGASAAWCALCATEERSCEACGTSHE